MPAHDIHSKSTPSLVLPEHLHAIWALPAGDVDYALRWRLIKTVFSRGLAKAERISQSRRERGERGIWQRRYWEHTVRDERDFERHVDYIHFNPVKHGHASSALEWPYLSFQRSVRPGRYPADWGGGSDEDACFGER